MKTTYIPYGYKLENGELVADEYQSKVLQLTFDLLGKGVDDTEVTMLLKHFDIPKFKSREIDFGSIDIIEMLKR